MKKLFFVIVAFWGFNLLAQAQESLISGSVTEQATKMPVEQASIRFLTAKDSTYVNGTVTNASGKFSFGLKRGRYIVHVSFLGYTDVYVNINANKAQTVMGNIELKEDEVLLDEAIVTAKIAEMAIKGDTVEYNAGSYKVQESAVVEDLLKKMPGAEVGEDGKITVNGKEVKKILVDGKEFFSDDPKVASKNLPASMIDKLQVLDQKSDMALMTGFDDGEEETVINLTVKKGMKQGLFGSATGGYGSDDRYGLSGMANLMVNDNQFTTLGGINNTNNEGFTDNAGNNFGGMRGGRGMNFGGRNGITESINGGFNFAVTSNEKLKWGGNIRYGNNNNNVEMNRYTQNYNTQDPRGDQYTISRSNGNNRSQNINSQLRFEWEPDSMTQIIFRPSLNYGTNQRHEISTSLTRYADLSDTINWMSRPSEYFSDGQSRDASGRLDVSRKLGKTGRVLSFSVSGGFNDTNNDGFNNSYLMFRDENGVKPDSLSRREQLFDTNNNGYNWRGYVSYVEPIGKSNFLQLNYSYRKNYSESETNTFSDAARQIVDTTATKRLENDFVNQEIGLNFKAVREKYNYTIGVAFQPSNSESRTYETLPPVDGSINYRTPSIVSNNVLNFAPVAQFNYMWDRRHNLRIDYNGRTQQPSTTQLSPVVDESNPLSITYGNPNLKPAFENSFRIRYQKFNIEEASTFMVFGRAGFTSNSIETNVTNRSGGVRETTYENVSGNWNANLRAVINRPLRNKKFTINSTTFGSYDVSNGFINGDRNTAASTQLSQNLGLRFSCDLMDFGLNANYVYSITQNSLERQDDRIINRYGGRFNTTWFLPYDFTFASDLNYSATSGSTEGYGQNEWLWNASVSKQIFKAKNGTLQVKFYDILNQRSNVMQSPNNNSYAETVTSSLKPYVMFSFQYKFQVFKGGATQPEMNPFDRPFRGGGGFRGGRR